MQTDSTLYTSRPASYQQPTRFPAFCTVFAIVLSQIRPLNNIIRTVSVGAAYKVWRHLCVRDACRIAKLPLGHGSTLVGCRFLFSRPTCLPLGCRYELYNTLYVSVGEELQPTPTISRVWIRDLGGKLGQTFFWRICIACFWVGNCRIDGSKLVCGLRRQRVLSVYLSATRSCLFVTGFGRHRDSGLVGLSPRSAHA